MQAGVRIVAWIMAMTGLAWNANAQFAKNTTSASAQEPGVLADAPELRAKLLNWESSAPPDVMEEIRTLRKGSAVDKGNAAYHLGTMGPHATSAILALLETFDDHTELEWREVGTLRSYTYSASHAPTSPAQEAAEALGKIGKAAFEPVALTLKDKDSNTRRYAAIALGKMSDKSAVEPLVQALKDNDSDVRIYAARSLGEIGDSSAVEPLIEAMNDGNSYAAIALGEIGGKPAVEALIQALRSNDPTLRSRAVVALGDAGDESAVEPLTQMKNDPLNADLIQYSIQKIHLKHPAEGTGGPRAAQTKTQREIAREQLLALGILVALFGLGGSVGLFS